MKKRLILFLLLVSLLSSILVTPVSATQETGIQKEKPVEEIIREDFGEMLELFNLDAEEKLTADSLIILEPVNFYIGENNLQKDRIVHFPVIDANGTIQCIYTIILSNDGYCTSIGTDFAPLLNKARKDFGRNVTLLQDGFNFYAVADSGSLHQIGSQVEALDSAEDVALRDAFSTALSPQMQFGRADKSAESTTITSFEVHSAYTDLARESVQAVDLPDLIKSTAVTGTKDLTNYPIVDQVIDGEQRGCCWAATIASILRFEKPSQYGTITAKDICDYMNIGYDDGANNNKARQALAHYLPAPYVPTTYGRVLTTQEIKTVIDNVDPAFMSCGYYYGFLGLKRLGHAVALCGYNFTSSVTRVRIMDPAYETKKWCNFTSGKWKFGFGDIEFTWEGTIRLLYN